MIHVKIVIPISLFLIMNTSIVPDPQRCVEQVDLLDGHLLGDACIVIPNPKRRKSSGRLVQTCVHSDYLKYIVDTMVVYGNKPVKEHDVYDKRTQKTYHQCYIQSPSSEWLTQQRKRWYPQGKKILPNDITITKQLLLRFFLDDGTRGTMGGLYIATDDFPVEDTERLAELIGNYCNFKLKLHKSGTKGQYRLYINASNKKNFLSIIGSCPVQSMQYKWE